LQYRIVEAARSAALRTRGGIGAGPHAVTGAGAETYADDEVSNSLKRRAAHPRLGSGAT